MARLARGAANRGRIHDLLNPPRTTDAGTYVEVTPEGERVVLRVPVTHVTPNKETK